MIRTYSELITIPTYEERLRYLMHGNRVGQSTFSHDRYLNQRFYRSRDWRRVRDIVIIRDEACDLGIIGRDIRDTIFVHHMNPITVEDFEHNYESLLDPELLITCSFSTHQAITYGDERHIFLLPQERRRGDTRLW